MEGFTYIDIFATKGIEYLLAIGFLGVLILFWRFLTTPMVKAFEPVSAQTVIPSIHEWFQILDGLYYHRGHSWLLPEGEDVVRIGLDDFAGKLIGKPNEIILPKIGSRIEQGEKGFKFAFNGKTIEMLSPVNGDVISVNEGVLKNPELIYHDPYEKGWLVKVKANRIKRDLKNLLSGSLVSVWMMDTIDSLRERMGGNLELVYQDGGIPMQGIASILSPDEWDKLAAEYLMSE